MENHGPKIKTLDIQCLKNSKSEMRANEWINFFVLVPNVESLTFFVRNIKIYQWKNHTGILQNLCHLSLDLKASDIGDFFKYIRPDSIEKLEIFSKWKDLHEFIFRQRGIKHLSLTKEQVANFNYFRKLSIDRLNIVSITEEVPSDLLSMIKQHPELKYFDFLYGHNEKPAELEISGELLETLCNLEELQNFSINFTPESQTHINSLARCKAEDICMSLFLREAIDEFAALKLEGLKRLSLTSGNFDDDLLEKFLMKRTDLLYLRLTLDEGESGVETKILPVDIILENCLRLEHLILDDSDCDEPVQYFYRYNGIEYKNLKELEISCFFINHSFAVLLEALPNLKKLIIKKCLDFEVQYLRSLTNMKKLEVCELRIHIDPKIVVTTEVKSILKNLFNNIETFYVEFDEAPEKFYQEILEEFPQDKYPDSIKREADRLNLQNS